MQFYEEPFFYSNRSRIHSIVLDTRSFPGRSAHVTTYNGLVTEVGSGGTCAERDGDVGGSHSGGNSSGRS